MKKPDPHVPIIPDFMGCLEINGYEYNISSATDTVVAFFEPKYDHLRYLNPDEECITLEFLPHDVLGTIVRYCIPLTHRRSTIMECEYEEYLAWQVKNGMSEFEF